MNTVIRPAGRIISIQKDWPTLSLPVKTMILPLYEKEGRGLVGQPEDSMHIEQRLVGFAEFLSQQAILQRGRTSVQRLYGGTIPASDIANCLLTYKA